VTPVPFEKLAEDQKEEGSIKGHHIGEAIQNLSLDKERVT